MGYGTEREKEGAGEREGRLFRAKLKHKLEAGAERLKTMLGQPHGAESTRNAVTLRDFRAAMARVGFVLDDSDAREMLSRATVDGEGRIDVELLVHHAEEDPHPFIIGFNKGEVRGQSHICGLVSVSLLLAQTMPCHFQKRMQTRSQIHRPDPEQTFHPLRSRFRSGRALGTRLAPQRLVGTCWTSATPPGA